MRNAYTRRPGKPATMPGRRLWAIGPFDGDYTSKNNVHEVMIPPDKCVYFWLGCEGKRWRRNRCWKHYREELALGEFGKSEPEPRPLCKRCRKRTVSGPKAELCVNCHSNEYSSRYYAEHKEQERERQQKWRDDHPEEERKRKQLWRQNNREHIRAYEKQWRENRARA